MPPRDPGEGWPLDPANTATDHDPDDAFGQALAQAATRRATGTPTPDDDWLTADDAPHATPYPHRRRTPMSPTADNWSTAAPPKRVRVRRTAKQPGDAEDATAVSDDWSAPTASPVRDRPAEGPGGAEDVSVASDDWSAAMASPVRDRPAEEPGVVEGARVRRAVGGPGGAEDASVVSDGWSAATASPVRDRPAEESGVAEDARVRRTAKQPGDAEDATAVSDSWSAATASPVRDRPAEEPGVAEDVRVRRAVEGSGGAEDASVVFGDWSAATASPVRDLRRGTAGGSGDADHPAAAGKAFAGDRSVTEEPPGRDRGWSTADAPPAKRRRGSTPDSPDSPDPATTAGPVEPGGPSTGRPPVGEPVGSAGGFGSAEAWLAGGAPTAAGGGRRARGRTSPPVSVPTPSGGGEPAAAPSRSDGATGAAKRGQGSRGQAPKPEPDPVAKAKDVCLTLLTGRARTRAELTQALARKGFEQQVIDQVLGRLDAVGLVDDAAFADSWVQSRHNYQGLGRRALKAELRRKGVSDEVAAEAVAAVDRDAEEQRARELVRKRLRTMSGLDDTAKLRRLLGMLARKGYSQGLAYSVVKDELNAEFDVE